MPELARFFGIVIRMYAADHPPPHFHAIYESHEAQIALRSWTVIRGSLPLRALELVREWAKAHQVELEACWQRCERLEAPGKIEPLQ